MARLNMALSREEIERRIEAGAAIRAERRLKKAQKLPQGMQEELKINLARTSSDMEFVSRGVLPLTPEITDKVKALFLPESDDSVKVKAFRRFFYEYENLISLVWGVSDELCEAAFVFWNSVLKAPETMVSGNSILRLFGCRPNKHFLEIIKNHKEKCLQGPFKRIIADFATRRLDAPGYFNNKTLVYEDWTEDEKRIWAEIVQLCQ